MIKARENKIQSTDLLVCFPKRAHLTLTHKPISSPSRASEPNKRPTHNHHLKRINTRPSGGGSGGPNSPLVWAKNNQIGQEVAEPTSPKVTCAGQIKVRPSRSSSGASCKSWQSVMEEIERIHNRTKDKKKSKWGENFGFKKDVMSFLTCLRNIRFDFRCFGAFPQTDIISSDDEEEFDDDEFEICEDHPQRRHSVLTDVNIDHNSNNNGNANAVFSKWFMVLQDNNEGKDIKLVQNEMNVVKGNDDSSSPAVPPPNALLLMRCRSAPAKSWLEEKVIEDHKEKEVVAKEVKMKQEDDDEQQKMKKRESLAILMKYDADFCKMSSEISQETWVVDGFKDSSFSRSRSWRR